MKPRVINPPDPLCEALAKGNLPLAVSLLEQGARTAMDPYWFERCRPALRRIARYQTALVRSNLHSTDPKTQADIQRMAARSVEPVHLASEGELPLCLRAESWKVRLDEGDGLRQLQGLAAASGESHAALAALLEARQLVPQPGFRFLPVTAEAFWCPQLYPAPILRESGRALPPRAMDLLARMMSLSGVDKQLLAIDEVRQACTPESLAAFAGQLLEDWGASRCKTCGWILDAMAYFGNDDSVPKIAAYLRHLPARRRYTQSMKGLYVLATMGTQASVSGIRSVAFDARQQTVKVYAKELLEAFAVESGMTIEAFEDANIPTCGMPESGLMEFEYLGRTYVGSLDASLKPILHDANGTLVNALPRPKTAADTEKARQQKADWMSFCRRLKSTARILKGRFEKAMIDAKTWTGKYFVERLLSHPIVGALAKGLVWGICPEKGEIRSFCVLEDGSTVNADGQAVEIEANDRIELLHPAFMTDSLVRWQQHFAARGQVQPFYQLTRKVYRHGDDFGLIGGVFPSMAFKRLIAVGWEPSSDTYGGNFWSMERKVYGISVVLEVSEGLHLEVCNALSDFQRIESIDGLARLPPVALSELIRELSTNLA